MINKENLYLEINYQECIESQLDEADKEAENLNSKLYSHEEFKKIARRIINGKE